MYKHFRNLTEEKKKRILDACVEEFAAKGYEGASTNEIVTKAGISKGILFHYFGSKRNLFLYVIDYVMEYTNRKFYSGIDELPKDLIERVMYRGRLKLQVAYEEPFIYELLYKAFVNTPTELKDELRQKYEGIFQLETERFFNGVDTAGFRSDIDPRKVFEAIMLFAEGMYRKYLAQFKNVPAGVALKCMDKYMRETEMFLNLLKYGFYNR